MASDPEPPGLGNILSGFNHQRTRPDLPPGYNWDTQIQKYCPINLPTLLDLKPRHKFGFVFCHRGLYDRAMKIPENSSLAINNGIMQGLNLHELDVRIHANGKDMFLAHDEVADRVTSKIGRWSTRDIKSILKTRLVIKPHNKQDRDDAVSYLKTRARVPHLDDLLRESHELFWGYKNPGFGKTQLMKDGRCFQLDLRRKDLPRAIVQFQKRRSDINKVMLKGYNLDFTSCKALETAAAEVAAEEGTTFAWNPFPFSPCIIMVFYSKPLIALALAAKGLSPSWMGMKSCDTLTFEDLCKVIRDQVTSYINVPNLNFIPEIVHSGLGLGYNKQTRKAINPLDGSPITDHKVEFESLVDRAMLEVSLELKEKHPSLRFSSCTRLCEVRNSVEELVADTKTGRLKRKPQGERGISLKLRGLHGGLYPRSDLVVADDPFAEIAARTWIDEYARLDRSQLQHMPYDKWLAQADEAVVAAVNGLNGPFLPNTFDGPLEGNFDFVEPRPSPQMEWHSFMTGLSRDESGQKVYLDDVDFF